LSLRVWPALKQFAAVRDLQVGLEQTVIRIPNQGDARGFLTHFFDSSEPFVQAASRSPLEISDAISLNENFDRPRVMGIVGLAAEGGGAFVAGCPDRMATRDELQRGLVEFVPDDLHPTVVGEAVPLHLLVFHDSTQAGA
jgi:hypothetical protein